MEIFVENIKCGGCANSIRNNLLNIHEVTDVLVDVTTGSVQVVLSKPLTPVLEEKIDSALRRMGYPKQGTVEGVSAVGAKAKSFVSCAVGKMSQSKDDE